MALNIVSGLMGAGKSYVLVNWLLLDELRNGRRHVWTNLPIHPELIARHLAGRNLAKVQGYLDRLHVLEDRFEVVRNAAGEPLMVPVSKRSVTYDAEGNRVEIPNEMVPCRLHMVRSFWRFTSPNSLIILDETADLWNARNWKQNAAEGVEENELQSYINHHRHYKDDLYCACQDPNDIDRQIRGKFQYLFLISNSLKENMFGDFWMTKGIRWPIQFFKVWAFHPSSMKKTDDTWTVWPTKKGFTFYDSFSASVRLPGKELPATDAGSSDYGQTYWHRMRLWLGRSWHLAIMACLALGGFVAVGSYCYAALNMDSAAVARASGLVPKEAAKAEDRPQQKELLRSGGASEPVALSPTPFTPIKVSEAAPVAKPEPKEPPRIVLAVPGAFRTSDGKWYRRGDDYEGKTISAVSVDWILFGDMSRRRTGL